MKPISGLERRAGKFHEKKSQLENPREIREEKNI